MSVLFYSRDLLFSSRVTGVARENGRTVSVVADSDHLIRGVGSGDVRLVILDLTTDGIAIAALVPQLRERAVGPISIIAFGPHVDEQGLAAARRAGCDQVYPRSRFNHQLVEILTP